MSTQGKNSTSGFNWWSAYGINSNTQIAAKVTMPGTSGTITNIGAYFGGDGVNLPNCYLCLWDMSGNLLANSGSFSQGSGSRLATGQGWANQSVSYGYSASQQLYVGWHRDPGTWVVFGYDNSTGTMYMNSSTSGSPTNLSSITSQSGNIGAYVTYNTSPPPASGGINVWDGSHWNKHPVKVWNGSSWIWRPCKTWNGSSWIRNG